MALRPFVPAKSVLDLLNGQAQATQFRSTVVFAISVIVGTVLFMKALINQQAVIKVFSQEITTTKPGILSGAQMLGDLLSPIRLALLCEYPSLRTVLGYSSPYTAQVISTLASMQPSEERVVMALVLLEGGLQPSATTTPPTVVQAVLDAVYPVDGFVPPTPVIIPPTPQQSLISMILPQIVNVVFIAGMII